MAQRGNQLEARDEAVRVDRGLRRDRAEVRGRPEPEADHTRRRHAAPEGCVRVIDVDHGHSVRREPREQFALGARDALEAAEALEVLGSSVRHDADARGGQGHQLGDVAGAVRAQLDDRMLMRRVHAQQGQRHADVVIEVATGRQRRAGQ